MHVAVLDAAHEDLRNIVAYISNENPNAAEILGRELLDEAMSLESLPHRRESHCKARLCNSPPPGSRNRSERSSLRDAEPCT